MATSEMLNKNSLKDMALKYGLVLDDLQLESFCKYAAFLRQYNQKVNLTAITQPQDIAEKHFLDSLLLARQPQVQATLVDVGSGAGFPGVVAKIYRPAIRLTLLEARGKKAVFLQELLLLLGLQGRVLQQRAEIAARGALRQSFDVCTARAVAALPTLCEYCLPLVKQGGWFIAMKGELGQELAQAKAAIKNLGATLHDVKTFTLPSGASRSLVLIEKTGPTPARYPRSSAAITKNPL